jgi:PTS system nitrogen regulatory IIA component
MFENANIMTLAEMAGYLKIAKRSLLRMAQRGDIPATKVASQWRFMRSVVDDWLIGRMKALPDQELETLIQSEKLPLPLPALIRPELVRLGLEVGGKEQVMAQLADIVLQAGLIQDRRPFLERLLEREEMVSTAIFPGIAIPHFRKPEECPVLEPRVALGVVPKGVEFNSFDGNPTYAFFLICANQVVVHLKIIAELALLFRRPNLVAELRRAREVPDALKALFPRSN